MDTKDAVGAIKIVAAVYLLFVVLPQLLDKYPFFAGYGWMMLVALVAVAICSVFGFLLRGGANY